MAKGISGYRLFLALTTLPKLPLPSSIKSSYLSIVEKEENILILVIDI